MKIFEKRNTSEVKSRRRRFFAFCLVLIISMLPAATVFADTIDLGYHMDRTSENYPDQEHNVIGRDAHEGDQFLVTSSGNIWVIYKDKSETEIGNVFTRNNGLVLDTYQTINKINNISSWTINGQEIDYYGEGETECIKVTLKEKPESPAQPDNPVNPTPSPSPKDDTKKEDKKDTGSSEKKKHSQSPTSWEGNPDEITAFYFKNGVMDPKAKFGKQEQGAACKAAFASALPAGWKQAFTFSMSVDGRHTTDLKDGMLKMYVPSSFQKAGRQFAIMAIDKNAIVHIYNDSDPQASVIASQLNFEGYAFCLIYKD
ncbi:MAG: hypothetical protein K6E90_09055 [Lachnospiraceae bacterium]|nr:hypothetical protein [Lachnospiraceae bacterium]